MNETGLRRRRGGADAAAEDVVAMNNALLQTDREAVIPPLTDTTGAIWRLTRMYCLVSALVATLAIVTTQTNTFGNTTRTSVLFDTAGSTAARTTTEVVATPPSPEVAEIPKNPPTNHRDEHSSSNNNNNNNNWWNLQKKETVEKSESSSSAAVEQDTSSHPELPPWLRWLLPPQDSNKLKNSLEQKEQKTSTPHGGVLPQTLLFLQSCLDPGLLHPSPQTLTDLIDKVIHSTPRLLAIANLLLSLTFLLHTAVADWFLGTRQHSQDWAASGRERLGGFLIFKLLLISAVVGPDTLDLLILLSWYTLLSFLRSLAHLCAGATQHTTQSGQTARPGVLHLLVAILLSDVLAAAVCVALFHGAGWGMVILLTCDCALLAVDVICNVLMHAGQVLEVQHADRVGALEAEELRAHHQQQQQQQREGHDSENEEEEKEDDDDDDEQVDRQMAMVRLEQQQVRRVYILETAVFGLQLFKHVLTVLHFVHIWSLYGIQFTLIDGVLALHLHSALSSASKKIAERRNLHRIARDMDGMFDDATEMELRKATAAGDVCCICLGTLTMGNVKKVGCGHLYHTSCLREVIERARSMEAARCPLCRASIMDGEHRNGMSSSSTTTAAAATTTTNPRNAVASAPATVPPSPPTNAADSEAEGSNPTEGTTTTTTTAAVAVSENNSETNESSNSTEEPASTTTARTDPAAADTNNDPPRDSGREAARPPNRNPEDHALFRFSTEGVMPGWVPLPSFSFEVIRRPNGTQQRQAAEPQDNNNENVHNEPSLLRRLLVVSGIVQMTPEEERAELDRLLDTFPQYDRPDLLRELRRRGSADAVARSILDRQERILPVGETR